MAELADDLVQDEDTRLDQAEGVVRSFCRWHIAPVRTESFTLRWGGRAILLPSMNVRSIVSVTNGDDATVYDLADYAFTPWGELTRAGDWVGYSWPGNTVVSFTHGYDTPPPEVTGVVQAVAERAIANPGSLIRTQDGPFSDTYSQTSSGTVVPLGLLPAEKSILSAYRLVSV